jgi:hypothetical protein
MIDCSFDFHVLHSFLFKAQSKGLHTEHGNQANNQSLHYGLIHKIMHHFYTR